MAGIFAALLLSVILSDTFEAPASKSFLEISSLLGLTYLGANRRMLRRRNVGCRRAPKIPQQRSRHRSFNKTPGHQRLD